MQLSSLTIENYRCYKEPVTISFDEFTGIVGRNDVGKSTIMDALAIFFEMAKMEKEDACVHGVTKSVKLTCEFSAVPSRIIIDADFETNLAEEFLLNRLGNLEIRKTYDCSGGTPKVSSVEALALHPTAEGATGFHLLKKADLLKVAQSLGVDLAAVNKGANAPIRKAIWKSFNDLELTDSFVSLDKEDGKEIWGKLSNYLPSFALFKSDRESSDQDSEAQDPLRTAIRDALQSLEGQLSAIQDHVIAEVQKIADATVEKISEMDATLATTLKPVVTAKKWESLFQTSITGDEGVPLNKRGSGVRRLVLLNFFRAKAEKAASETGHRSLIYAIEEPETSQHPHNQRLLMSALREISAVPGRQVIITTHTPNLAKLLPDTSLRFVERSDKGRSITSGGGAINERIASSLGILPDHTVKAFIGIEGKHDIEFLKIASRIYGAADDEAIDLEAMELAGRIIFIPLGGSNLALWASRLAVLEIPEFHLCDRDNIPPQAAKYQGHVDAVNQRKNCYATSTGKRELENYLHRDAIIEAYADNGHALELPLSFADFDDVPEIVAKAVHHNTGNPWPADDADKCRSKVSRAKAMLNSQVLHKMTHTRFKECDPDDEISGWLKAVKEMVSD
ncbi:ATP-binding protein [Asticcacaulis sp.]|uniref:ATP-binding protein n=1 Tax=Asticcacaulis sp. TaxID=1872648 RepID=UPI00261088AB|nr:ATP-binding protein [Asticcacaulis sp.]